MEGPLQSQIDGITLEVAAVADAGWRSWPRADSDVNVLLALPAAQKELADRQAEGVQGDPNAGRDAVVAAIKAAIMSLPHPYSAAGLAQFGFSTTAKDKGTRQEQAAPHLEVAAGSYRQPLVRTLGMKPWDYVVALVACALCGVDDPVGYVAGRASSSASTPSGEHDASETDPPRPRARPALRPLIALGTALVLLVVVALGGWALLAQGGSAAAVPAVGSLVDASSGHVFPAHAVPPSAASYGAIEGGNILRACDAAITQPCGYPAREAVYARPGDTIRFRLYLKNRFNGPISLLTIKATWGQPAASMTVAVGWPKPSASVHASPSTSDSIEVSFTDHHTHALAYVGGSAALYSSSQETPNGRLARLPDGVMSLSGITLENFGPPASCFDCIPAYARIIEFATHVD